MNFKHLSIVSAVAVFSIGMAVLPACTDDDLTVNTYGSSDGSIQFSANVQNAIIVSRSLMERQFVAFTSSRFENSNVWLITEEEMGIDGNSLGSKSAIRRDSVERPSSRGMLIENVEMMKNDEKNLYNAFKVYGYTYDPDKNYSSYSDAFGDTQRLISGETLKYDKSSDSWKPEGDDKYYWSNETYNYQFFAICPYDKPGYDTSYTYTITPGNSSTNADGSNAEEQEPITQTVTGVDAYEIKDDSNWPHLDYVVPDGAEDQIDVLYATKSIKVNDEGKFTMPSEGKVMFNFEHACTAIRLVSNLSAISTTIKSVTFNNVVMAGRFYPGRKRGWMLDTKKRTVTYTFNDGDITASANSTSSWDVLTGDKTLLMLPQTFSVGANASIEIAYETGTGENKTIAYIGHSLDGTTWTMGNTITYIISPTASTGEYEITSSLSEMNFGWGCDTVATEIRSCHIEAAANTTGRGNPDKIITPIPWKAYTEFSREIANDTIIATSVGTTGTTGSTGTTGTTGTTGVRPKYSEDDYECSKFKFLNSLRSGLGTPYEKLDTNYSKVSEPLSIYTPAGRKADQEIVSEEIKKMRDKGRLYYKKVDDVETPWNLSRDDGSDVGKNDGSNASYTSNCYVVHQAGLYKIPVVYGNIVQNDADVSKGTYKFDSGTRVLTEFKEHMGYTIPGAWISGYWQKSSGYKITGVRVEWQDAPNMVKDVYLTSDLNYVVFDIDEDNVKPGNFTISVYDDSSDQRALWTWHIWITPYMTGSDDISCDNQNGTKTSLANKPIGYVEGTYYHYYGREGVCHVVQVDGNGEHASVDIKLTQEEHWFRPKTCVYYQWGRKDPFPGYYCSESGGIDEYGCYKFTYTKKTTYPGPARNKNGTLVTNKSDGNIAYEKVTDTTIPDGICNPRSFFMVYGTHMDTWYMGMYNGNTEGPYCNLWGSTNGSLTSSTKTIYDPSPRGYKVPPLRYLPKGTYDGKDYSSKVNAFSDGQATEEDLFANYFNTSYTSHYDFINSYGFYFYTTSMTGYGTKAGGAEIFLPAFGHLNRQTSLPWAMGAYYYYWSSSCNLVNVNYGSSTASTDYNFYYINGGFLKGDLAVNCTAHVAWTATAMPVWPMRE